MAKEGEIRPAFSSEHELNFYVKQRGNHKRPYIFDFGKANRCDHPTMKIIARGGNMYRCTECNYSFQWPGAIMWPMHFTVIQGAFQMLHFAKEFGFRALQEVLRTPIGQTDNTPHKPVLPEGMSFMDVLAALESVDTTREDGGAQQLKALLERFWERPALKERETNAKELPSLAPNASNDPVPSL